MKRIFLSYRRSDTEDVTGRITDHLANRFGSDCLFKDVDSIPLGDDFRVVIAEALSQCSVLLAVIGDDWMGKDADGKRRIDDPNDYVRSELRAAIERGIPIIPVIVDDAEMPEAKSLPEDLREVSFRNAVVVRPDPDFRGDIDRLATHLAHQLDDGWSRRQFIAGAAGALLFLLVGGWLTYRYLSPVPPERERIRVGLKQWVGYTPLAVARGMELFPPEVDVEYTDIETVDSMNTALDNGTIDIALVLIETHVRASERYQTDDTNNARPVVFLKIDTSRGADGIVALREIEAVTDLGMTESGEERRFLYQHHDVSHFLFRHLCDVSGLRWRDLKDFGDERNPEAAAELFADPVETKYFAAGTYEPHLTTLLSTVEGAHILIDSDSEGVAGLIVDVMVTKRAFLDQHRAAILAMLEGWFAAVDILNDKSHPRYSQAMDYACRFNGQPKGGKDWSVATWMQNTPCDNREYEQYVAGLTGRSGAPAPWPDRKENTDFFKQRGGAPSKFHAVFERCAELRQGRNPGQLNSARFDGSQDVFFQD